MIGVPRPSHAFIRTGQPVAGPDHPQARFRLRNLAKNTRETPIKSINSHQIFCKYCSQVDFLQFLRSSVHDKITEKGGEDDHARRPSYAVPPPPHQYVRPRAALWGPNKQKENGNEISSKHVLHEKLFGTVWHSETNRGRRPRFAAV